MRVSIMVMIMGMDGSNYPSTKSWGSNNTLNNSLYGPKRVPYSVDKYTKIKKKKIKLCLWFQIKN